MDVKWAYIFNAPGADPVKDRYVLKRAGLESIIVPVPDFDVAVEVARQLAGEGVTSIEVCGWFGLENANRIREAAGPGIAVGAVMFGSEAIPALAAAYAAMA